MIGRELAHTLRTLSRAPGFCAAVVLVLALGIGANTAIYSVFDAVILRPLPYPAPERLVALPGAHRPDDMGEEISPGNFLDWRRQSRSFARLGAWAPATSQSHARRTARAPSGRSGHAGSAGGPRHEASVRAPVSARRGGRRRAPGDPEPRPLEEPLRRRSRRRRPDDPALRRRVPDRRRDAAGVSLSAERRPALGSVSVHARARRGPAEPLDLRRRAAGRRRFPRGGAARDGRRDGRAGVAIPVGQQGLGREGRSVFRNTSSGASARRCSSCWRPCCSCSWSRAPTSPTCNWRGPPDGGRRWRSVRRWEPRRPRSSASCCSKRQRSRLPAASPAFCSRRRA